MLVLISSTHIEGHSQLRHQIAWLATGGPQTAEGYRRAGRARSIYGCLDAPRQRTTSTSTATSSTTIDLSKNDGFSRSPTRSCRATGARTASGDQRVRPTPGRTAPSPCRARPQQPYTHPDGIFFGGARPTWSNRTIRQIAREGWAAPAGIIDFHTGLGPFGHRELICAVPPRPSRSAGARYGDEMTSPSGTSTSAIVVSIMMTPSRRTARCRGHADRHRVRHLFGARVLGAVRADSWLHQRAPRLAARARSRPT